MRQSQGWCRVGATTGNELKLIYPQPEAEPEQFIDLNFQHFFLQPMMDRSENVNTRRAGFLLFDSSQWHLSLQTHKLLVFHSRRRDSTSPPRVRRFFRCDYSTKWQITGGSPWNGRAVALASLSEGSRSPGGSARSRSVNPRAEEIRLLGADVLPLRRMCHNELQVRTHDSTGVGTLGTHRRPRHNAGIIHPTRLEEIGEAQWQDTLAVHLTGAFLWHPSRHPAMNSGRCGERLLTWSAPSALRGSIWCSGFMRQQKAASLL